jgi:ribose transport system permease protein/putative xylitol transport system permease protein
VFGTLNGIVFAKFKIPSFLVTLGSLSILSGTALLMTGGTSIPYRNPGVRWVATGYLIPAVPNIVVWGLLFYVLFVFVAFKTPFGRYCYALGENETVADLSGVDVDRYKIGAFLVSGFLCGVAGRLLAARSSSAAAGSGAVLLLNSTAAIVMRGTALTVGVGGPQHRHHRIVDQADLFPRVVEHRRRGRFDHESAADARPSRAERAPPNGR